MGKSLFFFTIFDGALALVKEKVKEEIEKSLCFFLIFEGTSLFTFLCDMVINDNS
jgi:hypothetical protein